MRTVWWTTLLLLAPVPAQEPAKEASSAQSDFKKVDDEYKAATKAYQEASAKVRQTDDYKKAAKERDQETVRKLMESVPPVETAKFASRMLELAAKYAGTEDGVPFLTWIVTRAGNDKAAKEMVVQAFATLRKDHIRSAQLMDVLQRGALDTATGGADATKKFFQEVIEQSEHNEVRAQAMVNLAKQLSGRDSTDQDKAKAVEQLLSAQKLAKGSALEGTIKSQLFELQRLQIGKEAPDIQAEDLDGVKFKLSDYRGKVVVLDFWGDW
jgi:hypothetical protein